jgi:NTP pyrophosphatase (non-canonical NTP hydrolase)
MAGNNMTDIKEYVKLATVTEAPASKALHRLKSDPEMYELFLKDMENAMDVLLKLDLWKKTIFYGKDYGCALKTKKSLLDKFLDFFRKKKELVMLTEESTRLLHGTIGIATESCELMQALAVYMKGEKPIDFTNVSEELSDVGWYQNVMFDVLGTNAEESFELWHKKLKLRYGDKFTEHAANNRKLEDERKLLEENT